MRTAWYPVGDGTITVNPSWSFEKSSGYRLKIDSVARFAMEMPNCTRAKCIGKSCQGPGGFFDEKNK